MRNWLLFLVCAAGSLALLAAGLLIPAPLRAVDDRVLNRAGAGTTSLLARAMALVQEKNVGAAELLVQTIEKQRLAGWNQVHGAIEKAGRANPRLEIMGAEPSARLFALFQEAAPPAKTQPLPFTDWIIRAKNRDRVLQLLQNSSDETVQQLLKLRTLTNTVSFPPSSSASGQALDSAICIAAMLSDERKLSVGLDNSFLNLALQANRGGGSQPIEDMLMDAMSLGQRFNWGQLAEFVGKIESPETLHHLAAEARNADGNLAALFSAVELSGNPSGVANYLSDFSESGMADLHGAFRFGAGGLDELLRRHERVHVSRLAPALLLDVSWRQPWLALSIKWILYFGGGFLLAAAFRFAMPRVRDLERPLQVRGVHFAREVLFASGFLLVVLLVSEPFLAQDSQKTVVRFQLRLPTPGDAVPAGHPGVSSNPSLMNHEVLLVMLLFLVLQGLLYAACLVKLAEIRRQRVSAPIKLKLLENEDHLFDAGLYLGFCGTIVSLILVSLGVFKQPSLMAAYSSTSFGIIFVSFFKICNLRPARRTLLLEAEAERETSELSTAKSFAAS